MTGISVMFTSFVRSLFFFFEMESMIIKLLWKNGVLT